jgi:hypothetical protein
MAQIWKPRTWIRPLGEWSKVIANTRKGKNTSYCVPAAAYCLVAALRPQNWFSRYSEEVLWLICDVCLGCRKGKVCLSSASYCHLRPTATSPDVSSECHMKEWNAYIWGLVFALHEGQEWAILYTYARAHPPTPSRGWHHRHLRGCLARAMRTASCDLQPYSLSSGATSSSLLIHIQTTSHFQPFLTRLKFEPHRLTAREWVGSRYCIY